jgi:hypothetical protein
MRAVLALPLVVACVAGGACVSSLDARSDVSLATPQALTTCAHAPAPLLARMWVSGSHKPCALVVDATAGATTGTCDVTPGAKRTLTVEWFTTLSHGGATLDVVLAQATHTLDLTRATTDTATVTVGAADVVTTGCVDAQNGGATSVRVDGVLVPVCDLDDDGASNLDEVCAQTDPFTAAG